MDGYESIVALKADPRTADIPVVFLTGRSRRTTSCALSARGTRLRPQPPEPAELLARVNSALRVKSLQDRSVTGGRARADESHRPPDRPVQPAAHRRAPARLDAGRSATATPWRSCSSTSTTSKWSTTRWPPGRGQGPRRDRRATAERDAPRGRSWPLGRGGVLAVLPHTSLEQAAVLAERLRRALGAEPVTIEGVAVPITVSIGGAAAEAPASTIWFSSPTPRCTTPRTPAATASAWPRGPGACRPTRRAADRRALAAPRRQRLRPALPPGGARAG